MKRIHKKITLPVAFVVWPDGLTIPGQRHLGTGGSKLSNGTPPASAKVLYFFEIMQDIIKNINWDATSFFEKLASSNKMAKTEGFHFCRVSGLEGFEECIHSLQSTANFIAVSDIAQGYTELNTTPHTRRVKTVFFAMRHAIDDMEARQECMDIMRELFRQFMSVLIQEKTRVEEENIYLDPRISFQEIDRYFLSGCACAFFQVATDVYTDLRYNQEEWD